MNRMKIAAVTLAVHLGMALAGALLAGAALAGVAFAQGGGTRWNFEGDVEGSAPAGFTFARTGQGSPGRWVVTRDPTAPAGPRVLAQADAEPTDYRFPVAIADAPSLKDVRAEVRCKPVSGRVDRACGLVFRYQDAGNYYVARANALEDDVRLFRVVGGRREQLAGWGGAVTSGAWHTLAVEARGDRLRVWWEGKVVIDAKDGTFAGPGRVGLWTKADSVTWFDALDVTSLPEAR